LRGLGFHRLREKHDVSSVVEAKNEQEEELRNSSSSARAQESSASSASSASDAGHTGEDANKKSSVFHLSFFGKGGQERHCTDGSTTQDEPKDNEEAKGTTKTATEDSLKTGEQELGTVLGCEKSTSAAPGLFPFWNKKAH